METGCVRDWRDSSRGNRPCSNSATAATSSVATAATIWKSVSRRSRGSLDCGSLDLLATAATGATAATIWKPGLTHLAATCDISWRVEQ